MSVCASSVIFARRGWPFSLGHGLRRGGEAGAVAVVAVVAVAVVAVAVAAAAAAAAAAGADWRPVTRERIEIKDNGDEAGSSSCERRRD